MPGMRNKQVTVHAAGATINPNRIVKIGAADRTVIQGAAATDRFLGVADIPANTTAASGERVDVVTSGEMEVLLGGTVARGGPVTSDASGQGVAAAPAAGTNNGIVGWATESGVVGDIITIQVAPGVLQG